MNIHSQRRDIADYGADEPPAYGSSPSSLLAQRLTWSQIADDDMLWGWYKTCIGREQDLVRHKEGLTEELNRQNQNLHSLHMQSQNLQQALNATESRRQEYEVAYNESQRVRAELAHGLREEQEMHKRTALTLDFENREHAKTEKELERLYFTLNRLSEFLTMVQVASKDDKVVIIDAYNKGDNIGSLMLEIEDKKQSIGNLEDKLKMAKQEFEAALANHQQAMELKEMEIAELEGLGPQGEYMTGGEAVPQKKKRSRSDRKSSKDSVVKK